MTSTKPQGHQPAKTSRIELRATYDDRDLLDRAAAALGTDRSSCLLAQGRLAAQRVLADRQHCLLDANAQREWERINSRLARSLPGLKRLLERPSPFAVPEVDQHPAWAATNRLSHWRPVTSSQTSAAARKSRPPGWWR